MLMLGFIAYLLATAHGQTDNLTTVDVSSHDLPDGLQNITNSPGTSSTATQVPLGQSKRCRHWSGFSDPYTYQLLTCGHCYKYLFPNTELFPFYGIYLASVNGSVIIPDINNATAVEKICDTLDSKTSCKQWVHCCMAAEECCDKQLTTAGIWQNTAKTDGNSDTCPHTWDGFACWEEVPAGTVVEAECPGFIPHAMPSENAYKTCDENGTWYMMSGKEWTNYTTCLTFDEFKRNIIIKIVCNCISLMALIPSLAIFLSYRVLRKQHRVQLHIHLFSSFILYAVINILWEVIVVYARMDKSNPETIMGRNTPGCQLLYVLTRYANSTNYFWMFIEGFYLHRLIVKAFKPPGKLWIFYVVGWASPWIPVGVYSIIRLYIKNENCWVGHIGGYEWIIYVPNLAALVANLVFLINILRILLTQLQSHPNEPNNYRRALKATFILIPLFGLQLFLIIYRPPMGTKAGNVYEHIQAIIVNSQGFFVALIFCLVNQEVLSNLRRTCVRHGLCKPQAAVNLNVTQTSELYTRESPTSSFHAPDGPNADSGGKSRNYIPMKPIGNNNGYLS